MSSKTTKSNSSSKKKPSKTKSSNENISQKIIELPMTKKEGFPTIKFDFSKYQKTYPNVPYELTPQGEKTITESKYYFVPVSIEFDDDEFGGEVLRYNISYFTDIIHNVIKDKFFLNPSDCVWTELATKQVPVGNEPYTEGRIVRTGDLKNKTTNIAIIPFSTTDTASIDELFVYYYKIDCGQIIKNDIVQYDRTQSMFKHYNFDDKKNNKDKLIFYIKVSIYKRSTGIPTKWRVFTRIFIRKRSARENGFPV